KVTTYTITFNGNGGTVGVAKKWVNAGDPINFMPTPKREGYTFTGWYTAASGGSKVYSTTKPTKNMALYAQWKKK
ncbi:MAG: InlB B-repeat-containing protein, partial [Lachnospiraceae bacterium]|nr:InlB B-repeat-containing protein [Lachnospiraceae bacterium]